ncbi:hypothetical protein V4F39_01550 [Aquincola sp. MAHUQ-54]|uniref:Uncharacterized protein n=1 Tax=Aquincola agrisoli TaxID=3119538 RepID=A0AAW9QBP2_9BURK
MADPIAQKIIDTALALRASHAGVPAIDVLDLAMQGHHGAHLNTDAYGKPWADWLDPPSPFARLLRDALAPHLPDDPYLTGDLWQVSATGTRLLLDDWDDVVRAFAARYRLWTL